MDFATTFKLNYKSKLHTHMESGKIKSTYPYGEWTHIYGEWKN